MMKRLTQFTLVLVILALFPCVLSPQVQKNLPGDLDRYIEDAMQDWKVPGLAIAVVKNDSIIMAKGYGVRKTGEEEKVDEHTLFAIASNTKAFTASLLGILVDQGKLGWDDRVIDYIPDLHMYDPYVTREISVRDLLTHRSGLPTFGGDHIWIGGQHSREEIISRLRYLEPSAPFRVRFQYQNLMFMLAGQVVQSIRKKSWEECISEQIFEPLGMRESNTSVSYLKDESNVATPHEIVRGELKPVEYDNVDVIAPAGAINSNVMDMARWMMLNLNAGVYGGKRILSGGVIRQLHSIQIPIGISTFSRDNFETRFSGYGLGWGVGEYKGYKVISHGGGLSGMISNQTLIPEEKLGIMVLSNLAPNSLPRAITYRILDALLGEPSRDWNEVYLNRREKERQKRKREEEKLLASRVRDTEPSLEPVKYTGTYHNRFSGEAEVRIEEGRLVFDYNPRHTGDLEHWHYNTFRVTWRNPIFDMSEKSFLTFCLDDNGKVAGLEVTFYHPIYFERLQKPE
jgi:CubicO group peptidase (beta-lactamase class C family)